ncbi:TAX1BP1 [Lepeophtheirus salmonis]|uniref:TAX1BP1 n=1 Tax=Lepeophtheirus salmonis TaxID=72036 RepID=A0A7R8H5J0_LEPSM|nr:TAX1BP1 [Lepeophtheirus salmonis]CAF2877206.1 TAX1BP1 [Lepeophtheirus salmonis]
MADAVSSHERIAGPQYSSSEHNTSSSSTRTHNTITNRKSTRDMYIYQNPHHHIHQPPNIQTHRRLLPKEPYGKQQFLRNFVSKPLIPIREGSEESLQLLSAFSEEDEEEEEMLPPLSSGSFSNTDQVRIVGSSSSVDFSEEDEEEEDDMSDLLLRLQQSQARMEHIKRMLVSQRGFIVESLKKMAEAQSQLKPKAQNTASTMTRIPISCDEESESSSSYGNHRAQSPSPDFKICPMCEVPFPSSMDDLDFESHVLDHFSFSMNDEAEPERYAVLFLWF